MSSYTIPYVIERTPAGERSFDIDSRLLQERMRGLSEVLTFNAEVNDHMIAVNEALGFVPTARGGQFQKRL